MEDHTDAQQSPEKAALMPGNLQQHVHAGHSGTQERWSLAELVCEHKRFHLRTLRNILVKGGSFEMLSLNTNTMFNPYSEFPFLQIRLS